MLKRVARGAAGALALAALAGCFEYVPVTLDAVPPGVGVQLHLNARPAELTEVDPDVGLVVRGTLVRRDPDRLFLRVPVSVHREGFEEKPIEEEVAILPGQVIEVEQRRRSTMRSALLVAGTAGVAAIVIGTIMQGHQQRTIPDIPPPDELRVAPHR